MIVSSRELFREVADVPAWERERILAERRIPDYLRAELESLLRYDSTSGESLTRRVSDVAHGALQRKEISGGCGRYRLVQLLGSGGMGAVYLAERRDGEIEQKVAIKVVRADADQPSWRDRFLRERQLLAYLSHPSIARLLDAGHTDDGWPYLVMEHVDGVSIDEYAKRLDLHAKLRLFLLVCNGVSHAHRHLIVHRDLKPSNILVDSSGQPKLLDFGIAKLLDQVTGETRTVERLLTPHYASPEQLRGDVQTTATDIYSLGAVLCRLLMGRSPRELIGNASPAGLDLPGEPNVAALSRLNPKLPRDIGYILRRALRHRPSERYASVDALADDIRAFLESRPIQARSTDISYRAGKFLQRYRMAVIAATITSGSLLGGWNVAKHQSGVAQARSQQVRHLTNKVLALDEVVDGLHGSSKALHEIVAMSKEHLDAVAAEARTDHGLALEVAEAYASLARAQGICVVANQEQHAQAEESLRKASVFLEPILSANPHNRRALLVAARIGHDRMVLAENDRRRDDALAETRNAAGHLDTLRLLGNLSPAEGESASEMFYGMALSHKNLHLLEDGIRYARSAIETSRFSSNAPMRASMAGSILADLLRLSGDIEGALLAIREARAHLENAAFRSDTERRSSWSRVLGREGKILGAAGGISLNRPDEAIPVLQKAFDLVEEWTSNEREDNWSRLLFVTAGRELGDTLRLRDPLRALAVYDHALMRLREVKDNPEARRGEVEVLAASAYALRRLNRNPQAKERLNTAFRLLAETQDYPAERVIPHEAAHEALRSLADHFAETRQPQQAAEVYEDLLSKLMLSKPDPRNDLSHAIALSPIYRSLAVLHSRIGQRSNAEAFQKLHVDLWRHWDGKLPNNGLVRRQLQATSNY